MNTVLSTGAVLGAILFWLVAIPLGVWLAWAAVLAVWRTGVWLIEVLCELVAGALILAWQPIGWVLWVIRKARGLV